MMHALGALALLLPASLLYLWKAEAVSDHLWVTRRFLVSAFPALVLLAFGAAAAVAARNSWWRAVAVAIVAVAIAYPLHALRPVRNMVDQRGFYVPLDAVCHTVGRNATILVVMRDLGDLRVPQMLRSYCGADVAVAKTSVAAGLVDLLATKTPRFFVVAAAPDVIAAVLPGASITTHVARNDRFLDPTLTHRPHAYATQSYGLSVARVR
jgi:hypothetical protein